MMKHATHLVLLVFFFALGPQFFVDAEAADVFLETNRSEFQKIPIWIMGFSSSETPQQQDDAEIGEQVDAILRADLRRTQVFEVIEQSTETLPLSKAGCRGRHPSRKPRRVRLRWSPGEESVAKTENC